MYYKGILNFEHYNHTAYTYTKFKPDKDILSLKFVIGHTEATDSYTSVWNHFFVLFLFFSQIALLLLFTITYCMFDWICELWNCINFDKMVGGNQFWVGIVNLASVM